MEKLSPLHKFKILVGEIEALTPNLTLTVANETESGLSVLPVVHNTCPSRKLVDDIIFAINIRLKLNNLEEIILQPFTSDISGFRIEASLKLH